MRTRAAIADLDITTWPDCNFAADATRFQTDNQTLTHLFPVSAGAHTVNLLVRKTGGTPAAPLRIFGRSLTALFIDHNGIGSS
jgi:hypothetical protein